MATSRKATFKDKKGSLNTKINFTNEEPFVGLEIKTVPEPFVGLEIKTVPVNKINMAGNREKEKIYICIIDANSTDYKVGTITEIEKWVDDNEYDAENYDVVMYELKNDKEINCSFERKTSIVID